MRKRIIALALTFTVAVTGLVSCGSEEEKTSYKHKYESMIDGKIFSVAYSPEKNDGEKYTDEELIAIDKGAEKAVADALSFVSAEYNNSLADLNKQVDRIFDADARVVELLSEVYKLSSFTGGAFKPVVGEEETYDPSALISIEENMLVKHNKDATVDLSGIAESYALSFAAESIKSAGIEEAIIKYGSSVARIDSREEKTPVEVAIHFADKDSESDAVINLEGGYLSTCTKNDEVKDNVSGGEIEALHNTVAVISENGMISSCLAKVFRGMETGEIKKLYENKAFEFEAVIVEEDGTVVCTQGIIDEGLFTEETEEE